VPPRCFIQTIGVVDSGHHANHTRASVAIADGKAMFWRSLGAAACMLSTLGVIWSIYEMVRWA
jgi:hypothetical protein